MARPGDWSAIGLDSDPTPGDPERINALADGFQKMGTKAREIITAIEAVMNTNNDSVFVGKAADALRSKVDSRLRGHVESVAGAFESSATALRAWRNVVIEQQAKADAALNAGRGLSATDPERENQKNAAKAAGEYQTAQASAYAGRIKGVSGISLPISDCEAFWEAFKWLAIILIIPALIFGGPIALLALGVNLALFIKTIVDVAKGDAGFLDLFLAGLGLIAPTTRALPIFSIGKAIGKGVAAGAKGIAQAFRTAFSKDFLFNGLLAGLRAMPTLANIAIRETGLFVVKNLRNFPVAAGNFAGNFGKIALGGFAQLTTAIGKLPGAVGRGFSVVGKGLGSFAAGTGQFLKAHLGGLQWTRIFLPVAGDEIRAFKALGMTDFQAFSQALKVGVLGRGVFGKDVFGLPMTSAIGRGIAAIPIEHGAGAAGGRTSFLTNLLNPEIRIPTVDFKGIGHASSAGFTAGHAFTAIDDLNITVGGIRSGDLGVSAVTSTTAVSPSGLHLPGNAGAHVPGGSVTTAIPSPHIGTPQINGALPGIQVNQAVLPIHIANGATPPSVHANTPHLGTADIGSSLHLSNPTFQSQALNNVGSLHVPTLSSQFGTQIGEGASRGFQANHFNLSIAEILHSPSASSFNAVHALNPPAVDRVNAALDLVHSPHATTQGVTPPVLHTAKSGDTQVTVNGIVSGADLKLTPPATIKVDNNPGLAGAQNAPNVPAVNAESVTRLNRAADLLVQPGTMHSPGPGTAHQPGTNLPGNAGVPGHGMDTYGAVPEPLLIPVRPQTATGVGAHNPGHSPIKVSDIGQSGIGPVTGKSEIPLPSIANRPGAYVAIERTEGGVRSFSLYGGGPDGRVDVLPGGHLRFTDTATGATTRFDSSGIVIDHGLRLTKADGMLRPTDQTLIAKPGGQLQVTSLAGEPAPNIKIQQLENGAVRLIDENGVTFHYNAQGTLDGRPLTAIAVKPTPAEWTDARPTGQQIADAWDADSLARTNVFRSAGDLAKVDLQHAQGEFTKVKEIFESKYPGKNVESVQHQLDELLDASLKDRPRLVAGVDGRGLDDATPPPPPPPPLAQAVPPPPPAHTAPMPPPPLVNQAGTAGPPAPVRPQRAVAPDFRKDFDGPSFGHESELSGFVVAMPEGSNRTFAFVKDLETGDALVMVTKDMGTGAYRTPPGLPEGLDVVRNGRWTTHTVELVSYPSKLGDLTGIAKRQDATEFLLDAFKGRLNLANHQPMERIVSADGRFALEITNGRHVIAGGNGLGLDDIGSVTMPRSGQQLTVGVKANDFGSGATPELQLLAKSPWYKPEFRHDGAVRALDHGALDNPAQVESAYTYLKSIISFTSTQVDKHGIPIGSHPGAAPHRGLTDPAVKNDWVVLPRTKPSLLLESLSDLDRAATLKLLREMDPIGDPAIWKESKLYILGGGEVAGHGINSAVIGGEKAMLFEFRQVPDQLNHLVPSQQAPTVAVHDALAQLGAGDSRKLGVQHINNFVGDADHRSSFASWFREQQPHHGGKTDDRIISMASAKVKADWISNFHPGAWDQIVAGQQPVVVRVLQMPQAGTLHDNDLFVSMSKPGAWSGKDKEPFSSQWDVDLAAKTNVFRRAGDTDAMVDVRMEDFARLKQSQQNLRDAELNVTLHGARGDGSSFDPAVGQQVKMDLGSAQADLDAGKAAFKRKHSMDFDELQTEVQAIQRGKLDGAGRFFDVPGGNVSFQVENGLVVSFAGHQAGVFHGAVNGREVTVTRTGGAGAAADNWTFRLGFGGRPNLIGRTMTLTDGPLAGEIVTLRGMAGQLDGSLGDAGIWPRHLSGDDLIVATPTGPLHYTRDGDFVGPVQTITRNLGPATPPPHLVDDADGLARWAAQVDSSRTHLTAAMNNKAVENLMKDVMAGSFTSKRGYEGFVKPSALADGTLASAVNDFNTVTKDLLLKGPDDRMTLYRGVSMDPHAAQADEFVDRLPSSTSNNLGFQEEWAKNGAASNRFVFEIDVPAGHGKLSMSYPKGYEPGEGAAKAWNPSQWEVTLAPTVLTRTGPDRIEDGMTIIPVRAEQIPPGRIADLLTEKWPGMNLDTAYDDFVRAFDNGSVNRWEGFEDVTVTTTKSADGNLTTLTVAKPWYPETLSIRIGKDLDSGTVSVTIDGGATEFSKAWKTTELGDLGTHLRGKVLQDSDLFSQLPRPAAWANKPIVINLMLEGLPDGAHVKLGNTGGRPTYELGNGPAGAQLHYLPDSGYRLTDGTKTYQFADTGMLIERHFQLQNVDGLRDVDVRYRHTAGGYDLPNGLPGQRVTARPAGGFRVTDGNRSWGFDAEGVRLDQQFHLAGANSGHSHVRPVSGRPHFEGPNAHLLVVQDLGSDGFRVNGARGHSQRYGADGVHIADGLALTDRQSLRGVLFTESGGAAGLQVVDLRGNPIPHTHATQLPNGQTMLVDGSMHDVQWFGRDGIRHGIGVQLAHADFPHPVYLYRTEGGNLSFVDHLGTHLPEQVTVVPGGYRITDPGTGIARTFDDAGAAIDRRIPLHQPGVQPGQQVIVVHDVHGNLAIRTAADMPGPGAVELTAGGGYRAIDNGSYHLYDVNGAHQAHGVPVTLPGETGFLEIGAAGGRRVDAQYQLSAGHQVNFDAAAGEITVTRAGGHDVFNLQGAVVREVTDLAPLGAGQVGGRITRDNTTGTVTWTDAAGARIPTPHRAMIDAQGNLRVEIDLNGSPRHGEYHQYDRTGRLTEQGFPVLNGDRRTPYTYVVDRTNNTWTRAGGTTTDGLFQHGKVEVTGVANGQIKLISSSANEVQVFERRWLPGGDILDSFRKTDTLGFGTWNRRTTWATYDNAGALSNWGKREFDNSGLSWRDVDHNGRSVHHYQQGLQKYPNPIAEQIIPMGKADKEITGHVLATRGAGDHWTWHRFDADGKLIGSGQRTWERLGDGFTDRINLQVNGEQTTEIAQQKFGNWNGQSTANQYHEFKLEDDAGRLTRPGDWEIQGKAAKPIGTGTKLFNDNILSSTRVGEQRPPVWFRDYVQRNPVPQGNVSHVANDAGYQIHRWEITGATNTGHGVRYVAGDESFVDVGLDGRFVRFEGKLHDGTKLKVGDHIEPPATAHPQANAMAWEAGEVKGWRLFDDTGNSWEDVAQLHGPNPHGQTGANWAVVRQSRPGGEVREFPDLADRNIWVQRDAHGNLVGSSHRTPPYGENPPTRYIESTGAADRSSWTWRELDDQGVATGAAGDRFHFKGSRDQSIAWDNSFRDFDAGGDLVRDRNMLDEGRFVESWRTADGRWHSAEFDKAGRRVDDALTFDRVWGNGDGQWSPTWNATSTHFKDSTPGTARVPDQVRFETPQHVGSDRPVRVREYHANADGQSDLAQWKEFDFDKVVRERALSGTNYLETDKLHGQWKLWDNTGAVIGERSDTGLVFELRDGRLTLTGNEFDFRGALTEFRGWNSRIGDAQRQPWLMHSDWTFDPKTLRPHGDPLRIEANYTSYGRLLTQKMLLTASTDLVLDFAATVIVLAIIAEAQHKPFTGEDALKALMFASVGTVLKTGASTALTETRLGGSLRDLKTTMGNLDGGALITKRPNNNKSTWGTDWAGNTGVTRWRGGTFDHGLGMMLLPLSAFVNGTISAAIFGVKGPDGQPVKLSGWDALAAGGISVATGYATANSLGLMRTIGIGLGAGRYFRKGGIADMALGFGFKLVEKGISFPLLAPALYRSMNPPWSRPLEPPPALTLPQHDAQAFTTSAPAESR